MYDTGSALSRASVDTARRIEAEHAKGAYSRSKTAIRRSEESHESYWFWRSEALKEQIMGDIHAYAEHVLAILLNPPAVQTYRDDRPDQVPGANQDAGGVPVYPGHDGHEHHMADGADGRDAHAS